MDSNEQGFSGSLKSTGTGKSASDSLKLNQTDDIIVQQRIRSNHALCQIAEQHEIQPDMLKHLLELEKFEIVIVCDDSGSMNTPIADSQKTRWDELCDIVKIVLEITVIFDQNGVDIYFLNRESLLNVTDPRIVDEEFRRPPRGFTPLVPVLKKIFKLPLDPSRRGKKLLVFIATDGEPTDDLGNRKISEFQDLLKNGRQIDMIYVSILLCSSDLTATKYLDKWDQKIPNLDVTDDFHSEKVKILRYRGGNYRFSHGDYIVKALVGSINREIDLLNEPTRIIGSTTN